MPRAHDDRPARIVIVDDHPVVRDGLAFVLEADPAFRVVGRAGSIEGARRRVRDLRPNILLLDQRLPDGQGIDACPGLLALHRGLRVVIVTTFGSADLARSAHEAGARGFLVKSSGPARVREAVATVAAGGRFVDPSASGCGYGLTAQEMRVLALLATGLTNARIAGRLGVSAETAKTHVRKVMAKLGAANRTDAAAIAVAAGLVRLP